MIIVIFFEKHIKDADAHKHARTLIPMNTRTQPYLYEHLRETEPANPLYYYYLNYSLDTHNSTDYTYS